MNPLVSALADVDLLAEIDAAEARVRDVRARQVALIAEVERRGIPTEHGARSTASWVRDRFNIADDKAKTLVLVGRAVEDRTELSGIPIPPDLPATATATALNDGAITLSHARAIVDGVAKLPPGTSREQRADTDALLATDAQKFTPHQIRMLAERVRYHLDQDGALQEEEHHLTTRELRFGVGRDGMTVLNARLDRETGAKLKAALHARDGKCAFPGCDHPPGTGEAHQSNTGPTAEQQATTTWSCYAHTTTGPSTINGGTST